MKTMQVLSKWPQIIYIAHEQSISTFDCITLENTYLLAKYQLVKYIQMTKRQIFLLNLFLFSNLQNFGKEYLVGNKRIYDLIFL